MKIKPTLTGGYVGLLALLITVAIIAFITWHSFGAPKTKSTSDIDTSDTSGISPQTLNPMTIEGQLQAKDRALEVKAMLEAKDRANLGQ